MKLTFLVFIMAAAVSSVCAATVNISGFDNPSRWSPPNVVINTNDYVFWQWDTPGITHNVGQSNRYQLEFIDNGVDGFRSNRKDKLLYKVQFLSEGVYYYIDEVFAESGMVGRVIVCDDYDNCPYLEWPSWEYPHSSTSTIASTPIIILLPLINEIMRLI